MEEQNIQYKIALYEKIRSIVISQGQVMSKDRDVIYYLPKGDTPKMYMHAIGVTKVPIEKIVYHISVDSGKDKNEVVESLAFFPEEKVANYALAWLYNYRLTNEYKLNDVHQDKLEEILNYISL